jgi:cation:H+ antiporter
MLILALQFAVLAAVIIVAGTVLARCADGIAEATGLGRLLIGSVLLAGATSLPELVVDITAVRVNLPDLAVGDLLGSSLMNLLILAVLDLTQHSRGQMLSRTAAAHAMAGLLSIALTGLVGMGVLTAGRVEGWTLLGIHAWGFAVLIGYALGVRMVFVDQMVTRHALQEHAPPNKDAAQPPRLWKPALGFLLAAIVIILAGPFLSITAGKIAEVSGLGNTFVGTTLVALTTSLPELVASMAALRLGALDLAVGNVFGSNAFNMALFVPLDLFYPGVLFANVCPVHLISVLAVVVATSVVIIGQLYNAERRRRFLEPDAMAVIALILGALAIIYYSG